VKPEPTIPPSADASERTAFAQYQDQLLADNMPSTAIAVTAVTIVYGSIQWMVRPEQIRAVLPLYALQIATPLVAWLLLRRTARRHAQLIALAAELTYTTALMMQMYVPFTSTSGTILFVSLKMMATALFFPWSARLQYLSAAVTVLIYWTLMFATGRPHDESVRLHHFAGPLIAAILSAAGARQADRVRRNLFEHDSEREELLSRLQLVLDNMPIGCIITDVERRYTYWNPAAQRIFGFRAEEVLGKLPFEVITPETERRRVDLGFQMLETQEVIGPALSENRTRDGRLIVCEWNSAALRRRDGTFFGVLSMCQDVTARQRASEEKRLLLDELRSANRLKSDFVATMSHELRTPLNVILGYHSLLQEGAFGALTEEQASVLQRLGQSALELLELINATLDVSRLETGRVEVDRRAVALHELVSQVAAETREQRDKPGVEVLWNVPDDLPTVRTDSAKLKVILKNLLSNALKFTDHGRVQVSAAVVAGGVELSVADTGIGMPPESLPIIFEPFRQVDSSTTRRHGGAGLGLYIVRRLIDMLGARIHVESQLGKGSTFRVWLPIVSDALEPPSRDAPW
jgi:PAS domain S-box-containing protein